MLEEELLYVLALQRAKGVGDIIAKKLISHCGSAKNVLKSKPSSIEKINGIGSYLLQNIFEKANIIDAEKELKYIQNNKVAYFYFLDDNYPSRLKQCVDAPIILFKEGNFELEEQRIISIVGTRNITSYGRDFCENFIEELKPYNPIIVSGFAYGVDICAHRAPVKNNLTTIGVMADRLQEV